MSLLVYFYFFLSKAAHKKLSWKFLRSWLVFLIINSLCGDGTAQKTQASASEIIASVLGGSYTMEQ